MKDILEEIDLRKIRTRLVDVNLFSLRKNMVAFSYIATYSAKLGY